MTLSADAWFPQGDESQSNDIVHYAIGNRALSEDGDAARAGGYG